MLKTIGVPLLVGVVSALATVTAVRYLTPGAECPPLAADGESTPNGDAVAGRRNAPKQVTALARLEPAGGVIDLSGTPGDRLAELKVGVGARVKKGDVLAVLESRSLRQAELDLACAQLEGAKNRKTAEEKYAEAVRKEAELLREQAKLERLELEAQNEKIEGLKIALHSAQADLDRLKALRTSATAADTEIVSDQQLEHQLALTEKAEKDLASACSELEKLEETIELSKQQADAKVETATANEARIPTLLELDSLGKSVELARRRLELTEIRAPSDGEILRTMLSAGETIGQQPILEMADTRQMIAVAEIYENDAPHVKEGVRVTVESDALPKAIDGEVTYIGSMILKNTVMSLTPTASADLRVIEARIKLNSSEEAGRLINLQVTVKIPVKPAPGKPSAATAVARPPQ